MVRVAPQDRLQPSLLDRLTDDDPGTRTEARDVHVLSLNELRQCVLRDLSWLLNTGNLEALVDLEDYPLVAASTLNYGIPHLAGTQASSVEVRDMERRLKQAIIRFEPRILAETIKIELSLGRGMFGHNALTFLIEGMLWAEPVPWHLYLKTEVDLEMGTFVVQEHAGRDE